jgi:hypothetical protein
VTRPRPWLTVASVLAAAVVLLDEPVVWAGQPAGDPTAGQVADWYAAHAARVLLGDALTSSPITPPPVTHTPSSLACSTTSCAAFATAGRSSSGKVIAPSSNEIRYRVTP